MTKFRPSILGIYSGIGPNLLPAKQLGWNILGNIEPRAGFNLDTFRLNFPGIYVSDSWDGIESFTSKVDILVGFPTCRFFSSAGFQWLTPEQRAKKRATFDEFEQCRKVIELIKPKLFLLENVQQMVKYYHFTIDKYQVDEIFISNYDYGNCQQRKRLWIIGNSKDLQLNFIHTNKCISKTLKNMIGDLPTNDIQEIQHVHLKPNNKLSFGGVSKGLDGKKYITVKDIADYSAFFKPLTALPYINRKGEQKIRIGLKRASWDKKCPVIGTHDSILHPDTGWPLTIRERARILGFPDSFKFLGTYKEQLIATGACIPLEFPLYLYKLIQEQWTGVKEFEHDYGKQYRFNLL